MKYMGKILSMCVVLSMVAALFAMTPARAKDTENSWLVDVGGAVPSSVSFQDVDWDPSGRYAMFVGYDSGAVPSARGCAWQYDALTDAWSERLPSPAAGADGLTVRSVEWDARNSWFMAIGDCGSSGTYFTIPIDGSLVAQTHTTLIGCTMYDLGMGTPPKMWTSGADGTTHAALKSIDLSNLAAGWVAEAGAALTGSVYEALEWDGGAGVVYMAGSATGGSTSLLEYWDGVTKTTYGPATGQSCAFTDTYLDSSKGKLLLTAKNRGAGVAALFALPLPLVTSPLEPIVNPSSITNFQGIDYGYGGVFVVVGSESTSGVIYDVFAGIYKAIKRADAGGVLMAHALNDVACRKSGTPMALIAGSAFKYSYTAAVSNIEVDTLYPHVSFIDIYQAGTMTSMLNTQLDVDPGTGMTQYNITTRAWHNGGRDLIRRVDIYAWQDQGVSEARPGTFDAAGYGNVRAHWIWYRTNGTFWQAAPSLASGEWWLQNAQCNWTMLPDGKNITVSFRVIPYQQVRWAPGPFVEAPGTRYDGLAPIGAWNPEDQSNIAALNALNSWNLEVDVTDSGAAVASAYDEFGVFRFTQIGTSGLPGGGNVIGSGGPGTWVWLTPGNQNATYSANSPYQLTVNVTNLVGANLGGTIQANRLTAMGGNLVNTSFTAPYASLYLFGPAYQNTLDAGRTTTTSTGDFNADWDPVRFGCAIPAVAEDYYKGVLTYAVLHP